MNIYSLGSMGLVYVPTYLPNKNQPFMDRSKDPYIISLWINIIHNAEYTHTFAE